MATIILEHTLHGVICSKNAWSQSNNPILDFCGGNCKRFTELRILSSLVTLETCFVYFIALTLAYKHWHDWCTTCCNTISTVCNVEDRVRTLREGDCRHFGGVFWSGGKWIWLDVLLSLKCTMPFSFGNKKNNWLQKAIKCWGLIGYVFHKSATWIILLSVGTSTPLVIALPSGLYILAVFPTRANHCTSTTYLKKQADFRLDSELDRDSAGGSVPFCASKLTVVD